MSDVPAEPRGRGGCLLRAGLALVVGIVLLSGLATLCDQVSDDGAPRPSGFNAGAAEEYARGDVTYIDAEHLFVVRLPSGEFLSFYDRSSKPQELDGDCRIRFDEIASPGTMPQVEGMRGAFVEECEGPRAVWRADGTFAFGSGYGDLDRFDTTIDDAGDLIIDTSERTCTRSRGVVGIPPFDVRTCRGGAD